MWLLLDCFIQSRKCMRLKFTGELCVLKMNNDVRFEEELLASSKLTWGIWPEHLKNSKNYTLMDCFWPKYVMFDLKQCWTQSIFGDAVYLCYCKFRLVTPPLPPWWGLRGWKFLILTTLNRWKRHFWEKNYIKNYFYLLKSTKVLKLLLKNVEEILFEQIFLGTHTSQTVSKHVWVCRCKESTEELFLMALKTDAKFEGKLTCTF